MRILVVEDEPSLREVLTRRLTQDGYSVDAASDGEEAVLYMQTGSYDCVVLDRLLPVIDGVTVLKRMRRKGFSAPVIMLTAKDSIEDRVTGLDAGADDYLIKPFAYDELSARIRVMLRRGTENRSSIISIEDLEMDTAARKVTRGGKNIELTAKEYALLEYLMHNRDKVLTRARITEHIWSFDFDCDSNIVDVYIRYLRRKVDTDFDVKLIHTVRGAGYVMKVED